MLITESFRFLVQDFLLTMLAFVMFGSRRMCIIKLFCTVTFFIHSAPFLVKRVVVCLCRVFERLGVCIRRWRDNQNN